MTKYIDVDSLRFPNICIFDMTLHGATVPMVRLVDLQKLVPAADVVEVVRCRECEYRDYDDAPYGKKVAVCTGAMAYSNTPDDWFCASGKRKDGKWLYCPYCGSKNQDGGKDNG